MFIWNSICPVKSIISAKRKICGVNWPAPFTDYRYNPEVLPLKGFRKFYVFLWCIFGQVQQFIFGIKDVLKTGRDRVIRNRVPYL